MAQCASCGGHIALEAAFTCNYCEKSHCSEHRLPERHDCDAFRTAERFSRESARLKRDGTVTLGDDGARNDSDSPNKTPCEECGRPCPAQDTYCSPCQADFESKQTTATREEIAEHWRKNDDLSPKSDSNRRLRWVLLVFFLVAGVGIVAAWMFGLV